MKKLLISFLIIWPGFTIVVQSQPVEEWSTPSAFTDSSSYNSNPDMVAGTSVIFYEKKQEQGGASDIYCVNLDTYCGEIAVLSNDSITYRNPKGLVTFSTNYCLYESNESGNFELYAISFDDNCNFGNPIRLTYTPEDENSLMVNRFEYKIAFLKGDKVTYAMIDIPFDSISLSDVQTIDTIPGTNPLISSGNFFWQRNEEGESHIYRSIYENKGWSAPEPFYIQGDNINLSVIDGSDFGFYTLMPIWENNGNYLYYSDLLILDSISLPPMDTIFQLSAFVYSIITDYFDGAYAFTSGYGVEQDIFFENQALGSEVVNISNNDYKDSNPRLFMGPLQYYYWEWYCLWETEINGHSVLYYSEQDVFFADVNEKLSEPVIELTPNPFKDKLNITVKNSDISAAIEIYTVQGKKIASTVTENGSFIWEPSKDNKDIPEGVYILKVKQGDKTFSEKIIYSR